MTLSEIITRTRNNTNDISTGSQFMEDTEIVDYANDGQNYIIDILVKQYREGKDSALSDLQSVLYEEAVTLMKANPTFSFTPTEKLKEFLEIFLWNTLGTLSVEMEIVSHQYFKKMKNNNYLGHAFNETTGKGRILATINRSIGSPLTDTFNVITSFSSIPYTSYPTVKIRYIVVPKTLVKTTQELLLLTTRLHEAVADYVLHRAYQKYGDTEKSKLYLEKCNSQI